MHSVWLFKDSQSLEQVAIETSDTVTKVLSRIFVLGGKILKMMVSRGRPQFRMKLFILCSGCYTRGEPIACTHFLCTHACTCRSTQQCIRTMPSGYALCSAFVPGDRHVLIGTKVCLQYSNYVVGTRGLYPETAMSLQYSN